MNFLQPLRQTLLPVFHVGRPGLRISWEYLGWGRQILTEKHRPPAAHASQPAQPSTRGFRGPSGRDLAGQPLCSARGNRRPGASRSHADPRSWGCGSHPQPESPLCTFRPCAGTRALGPGAGPSASGPAGAWSGDSTRGLARPTDFGPNALLGLSEQPAGSGPHPALARTPPTRQRPPTPQPERRPLQSLPSQAGAPSSGLGGETHQAQTWTQSHSSLSLSHTHTHTHTHT